MLCCYPNPCTPKPKQYLHFLIPFLRVYTQSRRRNCPWPMYLEYCKIDSMAALVQAVPACLTIQSEPSGAPQFRCFLQHIAPTDPRLGSPGNEFDDQPDLHSLFHTFSSYFTFPWHCLSPDNIAQPSLLFPPFSAFNQPLFNSRKFYIHFSSGFSPFLLILVNVECRASVTRAVSSWFTYPLALRTVTLPVASDSMCINSPSTAWNSRF